MWPRAAVCPGRGEAAQERRCIRAWLRPRRAVQAGPVPPLHRLLLVCTSGHWTAHTWHLHQVGETTPIPNFPLQHTLWLFGGLIFGTFTLIYKDSWHLLLCGKASRRLLHKVSKWSLATLTQHIGQLIERLSFNWMTQLQALASALSTALKCPWMTLSIIFASSLKFCRSAIMQTLMETVYLKETKATFRQQKEDSLFQTHKRIESDISRQTDISIFWWDRVTQLVWWGAGQRSVRLAEQGTGTLILSSEAGYQINKAPGRVPDSTLPHIWKRGFSPFSPLVPGQHLAQSHSSDRGSAGSPREAVKASLCPTLLVCLSLSISLFLTPSSPSLSSYQPQILPLFLDAFHSLRFATNNYLNPWDLAVRG